jgi:hypothetical protein
MKYVAVTHGDTVVNAVPIRTRWNPNMDKVIKKHIKKYHKFEHDTQNDAIFCAFQELKNGNYDFKGTLDSVRARFHKLNKQDEVPLNQGEDRIVSCVVTLKYASGKKIIINNLNSKFAKQF